MSKKSDHSLSQSRLLLDNMHAHQALKAAATTTGITGVLHQYGETLYTQTQKSVQEQQHLTGEHEKALNALKAKRTARKKAYMAQLKLARAQELPSWLVQRLELRGERELTNAGLHEQMRRFYTAALASPEALAELAKVSITQAALESGRDDILALDGLYSREASARAEKEHMTEQMVKQTKDIDAWFDATITLLTIANKETPQHLEAVGVTVK